MRFRMCVTLRMGKRRELLPGQRAQIGIGGRSLSKRMVSTRLAAMSTAEERKQIAAKGWKPEVLVLVGACGIAWIIWLPVLLGPAGLRIIKYQASLPFFVSLGTIGPAIASFLATRYEKGRWEMPSRFLPAGGRRKLVRRFFRHGVGV